LYAVCVKQFEISSASLLTFAPWYFDFPRLSLTLIFPWLRNVKFPDFFWFFPETSPDRRNHGIQFILIGCTTALAHLSVPYAQKQKVEKNWCKSSPEHEWCINFQLKEPGLGTELTRCSIIDRQITTQHTSTGLTRADIFFERSVEKIYAIFTMTLWHTR